MQDLKKKNLRQMYKKKKLQKKKTHTLSLSQVGWAALSSRRLKLRYLFIYKVILGLLPSY